MKERGFVYPAGFGHNKSKQKKMKTRVCVLPSAYSCRPHAHVSLLSSCTSVCNFGGTKAKFTMCMAYQTQCLSGSQRESSKGQTAVIMHVDLHMFKNRCICAALSVLQTGTFKAEVTHKCTFMPSSYLEMDENSMSPGYEPACQENKDNG